VIYDYTAGISRDQSNYSHALLQTKYTYVNPIFMPNISCIGFTGEQSTVKKAFTYIMPPDLTNFHEFTSSNKVWSNSLEAAGALRICRCRITNPQRKYTSLSTRSKHRHSLNPSFWIRNAKEHQVEVDSDHGVSQKFKHQNRNYRGANWRSEKRTGRGGQRNHRGPLKARRRRRTSSTKFLRKRTQRPMRVR